MNVILSIVQLVSVIYIVFKEYEKGSPTIFLWATLLLMFSIPHFISVLFKIYTFNSIVYLKASLFVILFNHVYLKLRKYNTESKNLQSSTYYTSNNQPNNYNKCFNLLLVVFVFAVIGRITILWNTYGSLKNLSWGLLYTNSESIYDKTFSVSTLFSFTKYFVLGSGGLAYYFLLNKKRIQFTITSAFIILYVMLTRNRILILPLITSLIMFYITINRNIKLKNIIVLTVFGFVTIYIVYFLRLFRHYGNFSEFLTKFNFYTFHKRLFEMILSGDGELGLRNVFLYFIKNNNNFPNFNKGHTYIRLMLLPIPTKFSFGLKPDDFAISMGSAWLNNFKNVQYSTHPTLYGDVFANFYWFGILSGGLWSAAANFLDKLIIKTEHTIYYYFIMAISGTVFVIIGRGSVYNGVLFGVLSFILYTIITLASKAIYKVIFKKRRL